MTAREQTQAGAAAAAAIASLIGECAALVVHQRGALGGAMYSHTQDLQRQALVAGKEMQSLTDELQRHDVGITDTGRTSNEKYVKRYLATDAALCRLVRLWHARVRQKMLHTATNVSVNCSKTTKCLTEEKHRSLHGKQTQTYLHSVLELLWRWR